MSDIQTWYKQVPMFTRLWLSATVGISLLARFGILPPQYLILQQYPLFKQLQVRSFAPGWVVWNFQIFPPILSHPAMATDDGSLLLPAESGHRVPLYVELLLPIQLFAPSGDRPLQAETGRLLLPVVLQLDSLCPDWAGHWTSGKWSEYCT